MAAVSQLYFGLGLLGQEAMPFSESGALSAIIISAKT
jgi:hypothetical protein